MGKYFKYKNGDILNGFLLIERTQKKKNNWYGLFKCPYCGKIFEYQLQHILRGECSSCGCQRVYGLASLNYPDEKRNNIDLTNQRIGKWTVLYCVGAKKEYSSRSLYWHCRCDCGTEKDVSSLILRRGESLSCGCNRISKGEYKIKQALQELDIPFEQEKTFNDCRNPFTNALLRFDFYLFDLDCCIEYDGEQHYKEVDFFHNSLKQNRFLDNLKEEYCKQNNIVLIRIPYTDISKIDKEYIQKILLLRR